MNYKKQLITILLEQTSPEKMLEVLTLLLSPNEFEDIAMRVEILTKLVQGESQRDIAAELGVGIATVTRGSRVFQAETAVCNRLFLNK